MRLRHARGAGLTIKARLVRNVALAMFVVLVVTSGFVYRRVEHALDRQLNRDLGSYQDVVTQAVANGTDVPSGTAGQSFQVVNAAGGIEFGSTRTPARRLLSRSQTLRAFRGAVVREDRGSFFPAARRPYRAEATRTSGARGQVVVVTAISRQPRDEALRELLLQLVIADILVLLAASYVGYRTARGALDPVERYRRAASRAGATGFTQLPVDADRDDELTRLGHTLNELLDGLEASARRERQFIADASHELRTPLSLLKAEVELALHRPRTAEESRAVLESVAMDIDRMVDLSNALLDLEELASPGASPRESVRVPDLLDTAASPFRSALEHDKRALEVVSDDVSVRISRRWIEAALVNLVANAVRHGGGTVSLSGRLVGGELVLVVADDGAGFDPSMVSTAFDRFTRADISRNTPGSGLGLALVRAAAEECGGSARLGTDPEHTEVIISIPARREGD